jgi:hypothetical protein
MSYETVGPIAPRTDVFDEYINENLKDIDNNIIKFNETLNKNLFDNFILKDNIRKLLIRITNYFLSNIEQEFVLDNITITGSIVNFNYNKYSDIDLHLLIDKNDYKNENDFNIIYELLSTKAKLWNYEHNNIKLFNHNIEIYIQDVTEIHRSSGIYDVITNKWIIKPNKQNKNIDKEYLKRKLNNIIYKIENILKSDSIEEVDKFIDNLKKYRKSGLESEGEYSYENLIYKFIKHHNYMDKLQDLKRKLSI